MKTIIIALFVVFASPASNASEQAFLSKWKGGTIAECDLPWTDFIITRILNNNALIQFNK